MTSDELRALQAPLKARFKEDPAAAKYTLSAKGKLSDGITCIVEISSGTAGLHPACGGDGTKACSGDMLLQSLVGCAGVTMSSVATAIGIADLKGTITAEGDLDFRGTLGVSKEAAIGFTEIRLLFDLDTSATDEQVKKLVDLTERYCVVYQTLRTPPKLIAKRT
jgi:uncharacterized OsmC-like protein